MNCQDFETIILALARRGLLDAATFEQSLSHTTGCVQCANRLTEERTLIGHVESVAAEIAVEEAPARVEKALLVSFRTHFSAASSATVKATPRNTRRTRRLKLAAVAAGILILISAIAAFWPRSGSVDHQHDAVRERPVPAIRDVPQQSALEREQSATNGGGDTNEKPGTLRHRPRKPASIDYEAVTEFFALMDDEQLDSPEIVQVVRVELPGSALIAVGLPVDVEMANEPVTADVVLGHDGLARAIRFVR